MTGRVMTLLTALWLQPLCCHRSRRDRFPGFYGTLPKACPSASTCYSRPTDCSSPNLSRSNHLSRFATFLADGRFLPRGIPMLKRVLALPGQTVCRDDLRITVDKTEMGVAREHDSRGRPLPVWQGCHVVADGEVFLMNWQSADLLDGRYFGALPASAIVGRAEPLWTGEEE